jgi:hypothetical protein
MYPQRAAPPAAEPCLSRPYSSRPKQKGGTLIAETITGYAEQLRALQEPDLCRPDRCPRPDCGCTRLQVHSRRERHPRQLVVAGEAVPVVNILVFICAACSATWRILPAFLARCLWRTWEIIAREVGGRPRGSAPAVPGRTVMRWRKRLAQAASLPVQALAVAGRELRAVAMRVGLEASRAELLAFHGQGMTHLAVLLHRLVPGVRLM